MNRIPDNALFSLADIAPLVGGAIPSAPAVPASTRISARLNEARSRTQFTRDITLAQLDAGNAYEHDLRIPFVIAGTIVVY